MSTSKLIKGDSLTEKSNAADGFKPATEVEKYSYTSARVAAPVYNKYKKANKPKVFGYYTDWSQYDGRLQGQDQPANRGRGYDLANVAPTAYDKIIFGFLGIVGDKGEKQYTIDNAANQIGKVTGEPTFLDPWGDFQSYVNCNQTTSGWDVDPATVTQSSTHGLLGGLRELQAKAKAVGHELALSMSIGGWTMSNGFHDMAKAEASRKVFAAGVVKLFKQFPMFSEVDIDWEYPNNEGNGNPHGPEDGANYALVIKELKAQLTAAGRSDVKISIASSAVVEVLGYSNVKALMDAGLYGINVMTYDFFGTPWAAELTHHTNLTPLSEGSWSVEAVVDFLIAEGFPSDRINIGYAGYTRNAKNAVVDSFSPLKGSYNPGQGTTVGSFESGCTEWYDTIYNYLDLENQKGRNGFNVYTDQVANADFLFNPTSGVFMSLDTPRSVKLKGEYAARHNLGGLFTWTIDQDNGVLLNAAREGLGYDIETEVVEMKPFYFEGINVTPSDKEEDAQQDDEPAIDNRAPKASIDMAVVGGSRVQLSAAASVDADGDALSYQWKLPAGAKASSLTAEVIDVETAVVSAKTTLDFSVQVTDSHGAKAEELHIFLDVVPALEAVVVVDDEPEQADVQPEPTPDADDVAGSWSASAIYVGGDKVTCNGHSYVAGWWTQGDRPDQNCGTGKPWTDLGAI